MTSHACDLETQFREEKTMCFIMRNTKNSNRGLVQIMAPTLSWALKNLINEPLNGLFVYFVYSDFNSAK